jgi:hypothetical protein
MLTNEKTIAKKITTHMSQNVTYVQEICGLLAVAGLSISAKMLSTLAICPLNALTFRSLTARLVCAAGAEATANTTTNTVTARNITNIFFMDISSV